MMYIKTYKLSLSNAPASSINNTVIDLGSMGDFRSIEPCNIYAVKLGTASPGELLVIDFSDDKVNWKTGVTGFTSNAQSYNNTSAAAMTIGSPCLNRYCRIQHTNGSTIQGPTSSIQISICPI